jgi:hypothetical protein
MDARPEHRRGDCQRPKAGSRRRPRAGHVDDGFALAILIDALLCSPLKNRDAVKLIARALSSGDFIVTPDFGSPSHLKYFYDPPKSLHVVDIAVTTLNGTIASTDIRLRLMASDN